MLHQTPVILVYSLALAFFAPLTHAQISVPPGTANLKTAQVPGTVTIRVPTVPAPYFLPLAGSVSQIANSKAAGTAATTGGAAATPVESIATLTHDMAGNNLNTSFSSIAPSVFGNSSGAIVPGKIIVSTIATALFGKSGVYVPNGELASPFSIAQNVSKQPVSAATAVASHATSVTPPKLVTLH